MKKSWLERFSRAARWYLSPAEAGEVIADYQEMLSGDRRTEEALCRDLGTPRQAARLLVQPRPYRMWLTVFAVLALCLALPGISPLPLVDPRLWWRLFDCYPPLSWPMALAGAVGALLWSRREGHKAETLPRALPVFLAVLLGWCGLLLVFNWIWMHDLDIWGALGTTSHLSFFAPYTVTTKPDPWLLILAGFAWMWIGGLGMVLVGLYALIKSRTEDRRWAAVYILALTVMLVSLTSLALLTSMNVEYGPDWWIYTFRWCLCYTAAGLVGAGVVLC